MGSDVHYHCRRSDRGLVERLVGMVERYARDHALPCRRIELRNCALVEAGRWDWPLGAPDRVHFAAERRATLEYFSNCQKSVDLFGVAFPPPFDLKGEDEPEILSRGQLVFDFRAGGILINLALEPNLEQAADESIPVSFMRIDGYWRSVFDYVAFPRFLTLCRLRYLPALDFTSSRDEKSVVMREMVDRGANVEALREMGDDEFYDGWLKGRPIIG